MRPRHVVTISSSRLSTRAWLTAPPCHRAASGPGCGTRAACPPAAPTAACGQAPPPDYIPRRCRHQGPLVKLLTNTTENPCCLPCTPGFDYATACLHVVERSCVSGRGGQAVRGAHVMSSRASRSRSAAAGFRSRLSASECVACMAVLSLDSKAQVRSRAVLTPADSASCGVSTIGVWIQVERPGTLWPERLGREVRTGHTLKPEPRQPQGIRVASPVACPSKV